MKRSFTKYAMEALENACIAAEFLGAEYIGTEHILAGIADVDGCTARKVLENNSVTNEAIRKLLLENLKRGSVQNAVSPAGYTPKAQMLLDIAGEEAGRYNCSGVGTEHLLLAMLKMPENAGLRLLSGLGAGMTSILADLYTAMGEDLKKHRAELEPEKNQGNSEDQKFLDRFSTDLCEEARSGRSDVIIGREKEIERIVQILSRRTKNNPCLVGEPGVGKTAIAHALAQRIVAGEIHGPVAGKRILSLDLPAMVAGSKFRGDFEDRVKKVINEVKEDGNIILFMDEIHTMIGAGGAEGSIDAANILKPSLSRGEIQILGATTMAEYRKYFEKDAALERRFQPVYVEQPERDEAVNILRGLRNAYEQHHEVRITDDAIEAAVDLSSRYINNRYLPDKAIDVMDEAASKARLSSYINASGSGKAHSELKGLNEKLEKAIMASDLKKASELKTQIDSLRTSIYEGISGADSKKRGVITVTRDTVADVVSGWTRIPVSRLTQEENRKLRDLEKELHKRVVAQDEAVSALSRAIRRGRSGIKDPKKPIGSFLFLGPTGVGKTELSKALAESLFGTENAIIRVDMSEYMEKHSVSKLIGSPPGYVGYDEGGQLSEQVRANPYSIILFDEIEKAHPDVFNILLQVLDEGRITDSHGRVTDFKNTIIIMTSNAGASRIMEPKNLGFASEKSEEADYKKMKDAVMNEVKHTFRPEFINRIDEIIVFAALSKDDMKDIAEIILKEIRQRLKDQLDIRITVTRKAKEYMVDKGYDPKYGARSLKRTVQSVFEDEMAQQILDGKIKHGDNVTVDAGNGKLVFRVRKVKE